MTFSGIYKASWQLFFLEISAGGWENKRRWAYYICLWAGIASIHCYHHLFQKQCLNHDLMLFDGIPSFWDSAGGAGVPNKRPKRLTGLWQLTGLFSGPLEVIVVLCKTPTTTYQYFLKKLYSILCPDSMPFFSPEVTHHVSNSSRLDRSKQWWFASWPQ